MARITEKKRIAIDHCIPKNAFYVTWTNSKGGQDFWMFGIRQMIGRTVEDTQLYMPNYTDIEASEAIVSQLSKSSTPYIICTSDQLTKDQVNALMGLKESTLVKYLKDKDNNIWEEIIPVDGEYEYDNFSEGYSIQIKFELQPRFTLSA